MSMSLPDVERAITKMYFQIFPTDRIKNIVPAYDGIVFHLENGKTWKYWYMTHECTEIPDWRDR